LWDFGVTINDIKRARATYRAAQWHAREDRGDLLRDRQRRSRRAAAAEAGQAGRGRDRLRCKQILRIVTVQKDLGLTTPGRRRAGADPARERAIGARPTGSSALEQARNAYKRLTNHMPLTALPTCRLPGTALPKARMSAVDLIDARSPRLAQAVEDRRSLDKQYDSQADTALPRFGLTVASDYRQRRARRDGPGLSMRGAMLTSSTGSTTAVRRRRSSAAFGARLRQADYELDRRRREVEQDIRIDYAGLGAAQGKIATIEDEITSATRVADLYKQQFRGGRRTVFDLLDSQQLLFGARAKQIANRLALRAAEYRVLQKLGGLFDLVSGGQPLPAARSAGPRQR